MQFSKAFSLVVDTEGGYVNDPADPGGETKYGISKRAYPGEDIKHLSLARAKFLYHRDYWQPVCSPLPDALRYDVFDAAVNQGQTTAIKLLQRAVGERDDGILGPLTLQAISSTPELRILSRFNGFRLLHYYSLNAAWWSRFGRGVTHRVAKNLTRL